MAKAQESESGARPDRTVEASPDVQFVTVKSGLGKAPPIQGPMQSDGRRILDHDSGDLVACWEQHPDHPDGEVYVAGDKPVKVALTKKVRELIKKEVLIALDEKGNKMEFWQLPA